MQIPVLLHPSTPTPEPAVSKKPHSHTSGDKIPIDVGMFFDKTDRFMHASLIPLECNAKWPALNTEPSKDQILYMLNPDVNHGVLQCHQLAKIVNGATGNLAELSNIPDNRLDNDKMHLIDYFVVSTD